MNKALRHEVKMLKYKKRVKQLGLKKNPLSEVPANYYAYRSHGKPCSCSLCSPYKFSRKVKHKNK